MTLTMNDIQKTIKKQKTRIILIAIVIFLFFLIYGLEGKRLKGEYYAPFQQGESWGFKNADEKTVIPAAFQQVQDFSEERAAVKLNNKWGYIDRSGELLVDYQFDQARKFQNEYAAVKKDGKWGYIALDGRWLLKPQYDKASNINLNNTAQVEINGQSKLINHFGEEIGWWRFIQMPLGPLIKNGVNWLTARISFITRSISTAFEAAIKGLEFLLLKIHPIIFIIITFVLVFFFIKKGIAVFSVVGLLFLWNIQLWDATMTTFAMVITATILAVSIGLPLGILAALNKNFYNVITPVLDFMQTMPAFVYLIPAIPFFGLGSVSAIFATIIFAIPPVIRLTALGIKQIDLELIEAADAFGSTKTQKLFKVQIPLAMPTIMAGVNQTIMLALSMVVIAAMIGAGGLGAKVWRAIQRLWIGKGFEAGIAVVVMAIIIDRITQHIGKGKK